MRTHFFAAITVSALAMAVLSAEAWAVEVKIRSAGPPPWENITFPVVHHLVAYDDGPLPTADSAGGENSTFPKGSPSPVYVGYVVIYTDGFFHAKFVGLETRKDIQVLFEPYEGLCGSPLRVRVWGSRPGGEPVGRNTAHAHATRRYAGEDSLHHRWGVAFS